MKMKVKRYNVPTPPKLTTAYKIPDLMRKGNDDLPINH